MNVVCKYWRFAISGRRLRNHAIPVTFGHGPSAIRSAFTLVELCVVITLLALFAGMTVTHLGGFTASARLRSAANQTASVLRLVQTQARTGGRPYLLSMNDDSGMIVSAPQRVGDGWRWQEVNRYVAASSARIEQVINDGASDKSETKASVRVGPEGRYAPFGIVWSCGKQFAGAVFDPWESVTFAIMAEPPRAESLNDWVRILEEAGEVD